MTESEILVKCWKQEHPATVRVLRALPEGQLHYRPHPRSRSAGELAWLMIYEEKSCIELLDTGETHWDERLPEMGLQQMIEAYENYHREMLSRFEKAKESVWTRPTKFFVDDQLVLESPLVEHLWIVLFDRIHHRGQLSVYLRPMGGKVPSIYGPSADDPGQ